MSAHGRLELEDKDFSNAYTGVQPGYVKIGSEQRMLTDVEKKSKELADLIHRQKAISRELSSAQTQVSTLQSKLSEMDASVRKCREELASLVSKEE